LRGSEGYHASVERITDGDWDVQRLRPQGRAPSRSLLAHWKLDESAGTSIKDYGPYGLTGTLNGATDPVSVAGKVKEAITFDGVDDYISVPNEGHIDFDLRSESFSLSFWEKADTTIATLARWVAKEDAVSFYRVRYHLQAGQYRIAFALRDQGALTTEIFYNATIVLISGVWFHIVATYNHVTDTMRLYTDGVERATGTFTPTSSTKTTNAVLALGADSGGLNPLDGTLDDVRIYGRELSAQEVLMLFRMTLDDDPEQPVVDDAPSVHGDYKRWSTEPRRLKD